MKPKFIGHYVGDEGACWLLWVAPSGDAVGIPCHQLNEGEYEEITLYDPVNGVQFTVSLPDGSWDELDEG
jgi:hypothetical protein